ncbi:DUF421 domain-containing protein [Bacillus sp. 1780r2a1]|uniref:DUF421 domain-containing protein n=1 Tax=Priestia TaxID=2800373 RepID=UPI002202211C|nr:DUF421 domain-containing protein [Bacillus sp. 1780r2a1]
MMEFIRIASELFVGFVCLFFLTKLLGRATITQLTTFDFISALVLGELVGNALYDSEIGIGKIAFAVTVWGALIYFTEVITQKNIPFRLFLEGRPSIIIRNGKLSYRELQRNRLDVDQLLHMLRSKNAFSIREVAYAILETDGTMSVLLKSDYAAPTKGDFQLPVTQPTLPIAFISDGRILTKNLTESGFTEKWLHQEIEKQGIPSVKQVLYAEWQQGDELFIQKY